MAKKKFVSDAGKKINARTGKVLGTSNQAKRKASSSSKPRNLFSDPNNPDPREATRLTQQKPVAAGQQFTPQDANFSRQDGTQTFESIHQASEMQRESIERNAALSEPGGWKKINDITKLALSPLSSEQINLNPQTPFGQTTEDILNSPVGRSILVAGIALSGGAALLAAEAAILATTTTTAVAEAATVGTIETVGATTIAESFAVNSVIQKQTASWLTKLAAAATNPKMVVGGLMAVIGTYPFAGFIKEEALQTLGFGINSAVRNGDFDGAQIAIDQQKEVLDPGMWDQIKNSIPFVNVLTQLDNFYQAARTKLAIDEKVVSDLQTQTDAGETSDEFYKRIAQERLDAKEAERIATAEYYKNVEAQRKAAKKAEREADAKYWAKIAADKEQKELEKRQQEEDYWSAYYRSLNEKRVDNTPSKLNFGLL